MKKSHILSKIRKILLYTMTFCLMFGNIFVLEKSTVQASQVSNIPTTSQGALTKYKKIPEINNDTILGADFSYYQQCLNWGKQYKNYMSKPVDDIFEYVKSQGINTISVKAAVNPTGKNAYLSLDNAIRTLKKAKVAGLQTNLVLLYSDEMTYARTQKLPDGWTADDAANKAKEYTKQVVEKLKKEKVTPTIITIGNEVDWNFLGITEGGGWNGWVAMGDISAYLKENGIKNAISIAAPKEASFVKEIIDGQLKWTDADYDYIGVNIYPDDNTNTYIKELRNTVKQCSEKKQLIVSSVKYARVNEEDTVNVYTQADGIYNLLSATVDENNAGGLIYDEAAYAGSWNSFFDDDGDAQISLAIFAYAKGNQVDTTRDPYKYGDDTGLKNKKVNINKIHNMTASTIRGMDISSYISLKNAGVKYYDNAGNEASLLKVLNDNGINYIRIRIWNDPYNEKGETYGGGANDIEKGLEIAKEAAQYNMKILLDIHYSDFWADPEVQLVPKAWQGDVNNQDKMRSHVYNYTKEVIQKFQKAGANIGMVQVGNEISQGFLGITEDTEKLSDIWRSKEKSKIVNSYMSAGCKAVRESAPNALIALHMGTISVSKFKGAMETWERDKVDYDVVGASYYTFWNSKPVQQLKSASEYVASKGKLFVVMETSALNSLEDADGTPNRIIHGEGYQYTPQGQVDMLTDMYNTILAKDNGLGAFYWEGAWIPVKAGQVNWKYNKEVANKYGTGWAAVGALGYFPDNKMYYRGEPTWGGTSWDNQTLFDSKGYPLDSLRFYKDAVASSIKQQIVSIDICDQKGRVINHAFVKVPVGKKITYNLPKISGYKPLKNKIQLTGTNESVRRIKVTYKMLPKKQIIKLKKAAYNLPYNTKYNFKKQVRAHGKLTFKSSNSSIIQIGSTTGKMVIKKPGRVTIKISAGSTKSYKAGSKRVTVYVVPKKQIIKKAVRSSKKLKVRVRRDTKASGYQIKIAADKKFTHNKKTAVFKGNKKTVLRIKNKKIKKNVYIAVRSYKIINKKKHFGPWSKTVKLR